MNNKKFIKGIIYDDEDILCDAMADTLANLSYIMDDEGQRKIDESMTKFNGIPSRDEFLTSIIIDSIVYPTPYTHNMIIPSTAVSDKLYEDLKQIDIGEYLKDAFIDLRVDIYHERNGYDDEEQGYEIVQNTPHGNVYKFHSKGDLLDFIKKGFENGHFTDEQYLKMIADIERLSA